MLSIMSMAALAMPLLALAAPTPETAIPAETPFHVKAHYIKAAAHPSSHSNFDGTYLEFYHTGAGENDVAFAASPKDSVMAFINSTDSSLQFNAGGIRYGMDFYPQVAYTSWQAATINPGESDAQFFIDDKGTIQAKGSVFGGWVICDWWHGVPQLMVYLKGRTTPLSQNCEHVVLQAKYPGTGSS